MDMVGKVFLEEVRVGEQHLDHSVGEPLHVPVPDVVVLALQLLDDLETLGQLGEHVHHRVGKVGVLSVFLELQKETISRYK